jgi:hypothetical protein
MKDRLADRERKEVQPKRELVTLKEVGNNSNKSQSHNQPP